MGDGVAQSGHDGRVDGEGVAQSGHDGRVDVTFHGDLGVITIRRGQNRFNEQFVEQVNEAMDKVLANPNAKAMATIGEGRYYGNGLDLDWLLGAPVEDADKLEKFATRGFTQLVVRLVTFPLPTIALINGHAFAAGAIMAVFHDHVIMQTGRGWWSLNEIHIGRLFNDFLVEMLRLKLGPAFSDSVVLGRKYTGEEAKAAGFMHEICAPSDLVITAQAWMKRTLPPAGYDRSHLSDMKIQAYRLALNYEQETLDRSKL